MKIFILIGLLWTLPATAITVKQEIVQQKEQVAKRVSKVEFKEKLKSLTEVQLIDVRTPGEYENGTIGKAINIDYRASNFEEMIGKLDKTKPVLIFCQAGGRSAKALQKFKALGFDYVLELEGGYGNW